MKCSKHKNYKAIYKPRTGCVECWYQYRKQHNLCLSCDKIKEDHNIAFCEECIDWFNEQAEEYYSKGPFI